MSIIYLDNAATTQISPTVLDEMIPYLKDQYGNPSSNYSLGVKARKAKEAARERVASLINAEPDEIFFTSGATEANNWVISSVVKEFENHGCIMVSNVEHLSVIKTADELTNDFYMIVSCSGNGIVHEKAIERRFDTNNRFVHLISVMAANNETGAVNDVLSLSNVSHVNFSMFHTDATQALGHIPIDVKKLKVDALSGTAHKIYGPKGVGFLFVSKISPLFDIVKKRCLLYGGHQEFGIRAGTENIAGIVGLGKACEETRMFLKDKKKENVLMQYKHKMLKELEKSVDAISNTGKLGESLPVLSLRIPGANNHELIQLLDQEGVCVSAGSACNENSGVSSRVLDAMGLNEREISETIRISIGRYNTEADIKNACEIIKEKVDTIRMFNS